jgi:hypothetical protein
MNMGLSSGNNAGKPILYVAGKVLDRFPYIRFTRYLNGTSSHFGNTQFESGAISEAFGVPYKGDVFVL